MLSSLQFTVPDIQSFLRRFSVTSFTKLLTVILALACCKVVFDLAVRLFFEWQLPLHGDAEIFVGVGRGILNGLLPYTDLFETKPPGIFLLMASSLALTGGDTLAKIAQTIAFLGSAVATTVMVWRSLRTLPYSWWRSALLCFAFLSAGSLALYSINEGGAMKAEIYGSFFGLLALLALTWNPGAISIRQSILAGIFLLCAVGTKEPFLITFFAALLLLPQTMRQGVRSLVLPCIVAFGGGLLLLLILGYAKGYFTIYLPEMLGHHVSRFGSPFARGALVEFLILQMMEYSVFLPIFLGALAGGILMLKAPAGKKAIIGLLFAVIVGATPFLLYEIGILQPVMFTESGLPGTPLPLLGCMAFLGAVIGLFAVASRAYLFIVLRMVLSLYLLMFAIGLGGELYLHHFVFAVPVYAALVLAFVKEIAATPLRRGAMIALEVACVFLIAVVIGRPFQYSSDRVRIFGERDALLTSSATAVDGMLDACGWDRYLVVGNNATEIAARTTHSPWGPGFVFYRYVVNPELPFFHEAYLRALAETSVIIVPSDPAPPQPAEIAAVKQMTLDPPSCATPFLPVEGFTVMFRR